MAAQPAQAAPAPEMAPAPQLSNSVMAVPSKFNGDRATYRLWMRGINMYFATNPTFFILDESKFLTALSYLEGVAATTFTDLYYGN